MDKINSEIEKDNLGEIKFDNPEYCEMLRKCVDCIYSDDGHHQKQDVCYKCMSVHNQYEKKA